MMMPMKFVPLTSAAMIAASPTMWSAVGWPPMVLFLVAAILGGLGSLFTKLARRNKVSVRFGVSVFGHGCMLSMAIAMLCYTLVNGEEHPYLVIGLPLAGSVGIIDGKNLARDLISTVGRWAAEGDKS